MRKGRDPTLQQPTCLLQGWPLPPKAEHAKGPAATMRSLKRPRLCAHCL